MASSCVVCRNPSTSHCAGCRSTTYCSADCQRRHWSRHRPICSIPVENFTRKTDPSILSPVDTKNMMLLISNFLARYQQLTQKEESTFLGLTSSIIVSDVFDVVVKNSWLVDQKYMTMFEEGSNYFKLSGDPKYQLELRMENAFLILGLCKEQGIEAAKETVALLPVK